MGTDPAALTDAVQATITRGQPAPPPPPAPDTAAAADAGQADKACPDTSR